MYIGINMKEGVKRLKTLGLPNDIIKLIEIYTKVLLHIWERLKLDYFYKDLLILKYSSCQLFVGLL